MVKGALCLYCKTVNSRRMLSSMERVWTEVCSRMSRVGEIGISRYVGPCYTRAVLNILLQAYQGNE